ncbi:MAG: hypothetical protein RRC34_14650 [Lentisphaeria bacterium]|nr:hypothetical protein [Lentisphaeria bacterium]
MRCQHLIVVGMALFLSACDRSSEPVYQLDLESLKKTDPARVIYRQETVIKIPLANPSGFDFSDGRFAVIGSGQVVFSQVKSGMTRLLDTPFSATAAAFGPGGKLYVAGETGIHSVAPNGELTPWVRPPEGSFICSMAGNEAFLWLADSNHGRVLAYDPEGRMVYAIDGEKGPKGEPHFVLPSRFFDLYPAPDGSLWVTNPGRHRLENYRADGSFLSSWGEAGTRLEAFCGCCNPTHVAVFPDGRFITVEKGLTRIKEYDQQGTLTGVVADAALLKNTGAGLATVILPDNRVAVLDPDAGVIRVFFKK